MLPSYSVIAADTLRDFDLGLSPVDLGQWPYMAGQSRVEPIHQV